MPVPDDLRLQDQDTHPMCERNMRCKEVVGQCLYESGARGIHGKAEEVALVGFMVAPTGEYKMRDYRRNIKETYLKVNQECGSFFLIFVLPVLISLVSNWIAKWILNRTDLKRIRAQAFDAFIDSQQSMTDTRTSIPTPTKKPTEP